VSQHARHRKPSRRQPASHARHRRRSPASSALRRGQVVTVIVAGTTLAAGAATAWAVTAGPGGAPAAASGHRAPAQLDRSRAAASPTGQPDGTASQSPAPATTRAPVRRKAAATPRPTPSATTPAPPPPVYRNPVRAITGIIPERVDMGVDYGGNGPVYALGDAVITNATGDSAGWPGGGWITYQLTSGPAKGLQIYLAEDVQPTVQVGQHVTADTVIANMVNRGDGIETGWAMPDGASAESQLTVAGGISGGGPFPTQIGLNFDRLLVALGTPAAPNLTSAGYGTLPAGYPADWSSLLG
jgi:murein DD-endopeptidase MepM/ murein hydrolase activator NlpD